MRDIFVTLLVFIGLIYTLKKPYVGILLWSWLGYMNPHRLAYGFAYTMPFAQIAAIITLIAMFLSKEKKTFPVNSITVVWLLFILYMSVGTAFAVFPDLAFTQLIRVYKIHFMVLLTLLLINSKEKINQLIWVITLSIGFYGVKGGVFTLLSGGAYRVWGPPKTFIADNNELGLAVLMILPLFFYLKNQLENKWGKRAITIAILLCFITVMGTYSRGAFIALICMMFFFWLKRSDKAMIALVSILLLSISLSFIPEKYVERLYTIENFEEDGSAMGRLNAWTVAINISNDHFFAGGFRHWSSDTFAQYAPVPEDVHSAHSIYFEILGEQGYVGLFLFLMIYFLTWRYAAWIIVKTRGDPDLSWSNELARMIQVSLIAYASGGAFLGLAYWDLPYHLMAIIVLLREVVKKSLLKSDNKSKNIMIDDSQSNSIQQVEKKKWKWEK